MQLVLLRHPPIEVEPGRCYGRLDVPLRGDLGLALDRVVTAMPLVARVWTSPAQRCQLFADAIARARGLTAKIDERLQELHFGEWEGRRWDDVPRPELDRWAADPLTFAPPGGESGQQLLDRVAAVCADLRRAGEDAIVVTHGGPLRVMPALLHDEPPDLLAQPPGPGDFVVVEAEQLPGDKHAQHGALHK